jgi:hypothetical protein
LALSVVDRMNWSEIRAEVKSRAHGIGYSGWTARLDQLIKEAYLDLCFMFEHPELEEYDDLAVAQNAVTMPIPEDSYMVIGIAEMSAIGGEPTGWPKFRHHSILSSLYSSTAGQPEHYSRFATDFYFDRKLDAQRFYRVFYIRRPDNPDLDSTVTFPEFGDQWDGHLIELALARIGVAINNQALAVQNATLFRDFAGQQPQPQLAKSTAANLPSTETTDAAQGGGLT